MTQLIEINGVPTDIRYVYVNVAFASVVLFAFAPLVVLQFMRLRATVKMGNKSGVRCVFRFEHRPLILIKVTQNR